MTPTIRNTTTYVVYNQTRNKYACTVDTSALIAWKDYSVNNGGGNASWGDCITHFDNKVSAEYYCNEAKRMCKYRENILLLEETITTTFKETSFLEDSLVLH